MGPQRPLPWAIVLAWLTLAVITLATRPLLPVDETRYLSVAWEMWSSGDLLVMHLNGEPYSHKPPLLFWLINLSWWLFGVNEWSARLISPLFGLGTVLMTIPLARRLWPGEMEPAQTAPWILLGAAAWNLYGTATNFDMMLAFFAATGALALHHVWTEGRLHGWLLLGAAIGGGLLAKGPAILVHLLPLALFAPWWAGAPPARGWRHWYLALGTAVVLGVGIALLWAVPAAVAGGPEYRDAIFWGQTAGRMVESFAHRHPWWWYLPLLPLLLFPWLFWGRLWGRLWRARKFALDRGERLCLVWFGATLLIFSLISGKQVHYLLPAFTPFALFTARRISRISQPPARAWPIGFLIIVAGVLYATLPYWQERLDTPVWMAAISPLWGLPLILLGAWLSLWRPRQNGSAAVVLSLTIGTVIATFHLGIVTAIAPAYDLRPAAHELARLQSEGREIAYPGKYHGEFHFLGRLIHPLAVPQTDAALRQWADDHENGIVIHFHEADEAEKFEREALYSQDYRSGRLSLLPAPVYRDRE